jgi:hypothetical protein
MRPLALAEKWPSLTTALAALGSEGRTGGALGASGSSLAVRLAATIGALRSGELSRLMGADALRTLEAAGARGLIGRLHGELEGLEKLSASENAPWRALFIPLVDDREARMVRFFIARREDDGDAADQDQRDTRFVVETELSHIGPLQLDGLASSKRLALVLRSHTDLPDQWRAELRALFADTMTLTGIDGGLAFQTVDPFPVAPLSTLAEDRPDPDIFA